jgi:hypothetical protein
MSAIDDLAIQLANDTGYSVGNKLFKGNMPPTPDSCIAIINRMGIQPSKYLPEKNPGFQVLIRDTSYPNGESMLARVRSSLQSKTPQTIGSTYFFYIYVMAEGGWIGRDDLGRDLWSINFQTMTR